MSYRPKSEGKKLPRRHTSAYRRQSARGRGKLARPLRLTPATPPVVSSHRAGVAEAAPNEDGQPQPNTDIIPQGAGNVVSGFFRGLPVGGSVGQTALNVSAGARTQWAAIWSGAWMLVILAALS